MIQIFFNSFHTGRGPVEMLTGTVTMAVGSLRSHLCHDLLLNIKILTITHYRYIPHLICPHYPHILFP